MYFFGHTRSEVTYENALVRPCVRPSVRNAFFSGTAHQIFLVFGMQWDIYKCSKVTEPDFWNLFSMTRNCAKIGPKWAKNSIFGHNSKLCHLIFLSFFCTNLMENMWNKMVKLFCLRKFWLLGNGPTITQNSLKIGFFGQIWIFIWNFI